MTIVVGVATPEGLVLASDSRTTYSDGTRHRIASDSAQKMFVVGDMGVATFGWAFLGTDTIAGVMDQFTAQVADDDCHDIDKFTEALGRFFDKRFRKEVEDANEWGTPERGWPLGFLVAGYDDQGVGHIKSALVPGPEIDPEQVANTVNLGMMWRGQTQVIGRLIKGVDAAGLVQLDPEGEQINDATGELLGKLEYRRLEPTALQDGVDFAAFLVRTTIDMQRFSDGLVEGSGEVPGCGGPIQILAIERSGPTWVAPLTLGAPSHPGSAEEARR